MRAAALLATALTLAAAAQSPPSRPGEPYPLASVRPGLEATGWTVFSGQEPLPFRARVTGVVTQDAARGPVIICELSGQGLEELGVLEAMSGSPLYVGDRLLGALAFAWPFAKRPLCGVTPAERLLPLMEAQVQPPGGAPARALTAAQSLPLLLGASQLAPPEPPRSPLGALQAAGFGWSGAGPDGEPPPSPRRPGPGEMVAVQLVSGDLEFAAFGTVTAVDGERFVAFGHPFLHLGAVDLPVASARVDALIPRLEVGMKLSSSGQEVGALSLDAASGVSGRFGAKADTLPLALTLSGPGHPVRHFEVRLVRHRFLTPSLLQGTLAQAQQAVEGIADPKTVTLSWRAELAGGQRLELGPLRFSGPAPFVPLNDFAGNLLDLLLNNAREPVEVRRLELTLFTEPGLSGGALSALWPGHPVAVRGEALPLRATFQPLRGAPETLEVALDTAGWPEGEVALWAGDAFSLLRRLTGTEPAQPSTAQELLAYLRRIPPNDRLYVAVLVPSEGARVLSGRRLDAPPPSVGGLLSGPPPQEAPPAFRLLAVVPGPETGAFEGLLETRVPVRSPRR